MRYENNRMEHNTLNENAYEEQMLGDKARLVRQLLEQQLYMLCRQFEEETGMILRGIEITRSTNFKKRVIQDIHADVTI